MFSIGEKVACIVDGWEDPLMTSEPFPLKRNGVFVVKAVYPKGSKSICQSSGQPATAGLDLISIGEVNHDLMAWCHVVGLDLTSHDLWQADWFRRLERKDISQGLATLTGLFDTTKTPEVVDA